MIHIELLNFSEKWGFKLSISFILSTFSFKIRISLSINKLGGHGKSLNAYPKKWMEEIKQYFVNLEKAKANKGAKSNPV